MGRSLGIGGGGRPAGEVGTGSGLRRVGWVYFIGWMRFGYLIL